MVTNEFDDENVSAPLRTPRRILCFLFTSHIEKHLLNVLAHRWKRSHVPNQLGYFFFLLLLRGLKKNFYYKESNIWTNSLRLFILLFFFLLIS